MKQPLYGLDSLFIAFFFLTYCEELRLFRNKGETIPFYRATEHFL